MHQNKKKEASLPSFNFLNAFSGCVRALDFFSMIFLFCFKLYNTIQKRVVICCKQQYLVVKKKKLKNCFLFVCTYFEKITTNIIATQKKHILKPNEPLISSLFFLNLNAAFHGILHIFLQKQQHHLTKKLYCDCCSIYMYALVVFFCIKISFSL